ncbi:polyribonucleotide nucleotidyltransferase [Bythopirellula goksoeyrii]|uniref:Polyribonucleotide nucleotidyltransferase n=1 Tax=Bythopirellula goksoeyrii TaxID=1400387 RepID=A0A5B9QCF4_9BACT|nr:polyribonucleotide nucleotidyltransferase [Bythopirellula goksoeyrii]QEG36747.1 Polyribonucleotide nucleotidyltransferase [Bythopirellula goksoeyrii]
MNKIRVEKQIGSGVFSIETGYLAKQAAGACLVQYGDTTVLSAAASGPARPGIDFFPLMCDYRERVAAAGKFPGGFMKREGRPTTKETLTARLIDRPIRPMFPEGYNDEVQIQNFVMSSDKQTDGDVLAMNGACAALGISPLPFQGPLASVRVGYIDGEFIPFPTQDDLEASSLDLIVSGNKEAVLMIEGFAREMPEDTMAEAIMAAHGFIRELCDLQEELIAKVGTEKMKFEAPPSDGLFEVLKEKYGARFSEANLIDGKHERHDAVVALRDEAVAELVPDPDAEGAYTLDSFYKNWHDLESHVSREQILSGTRSDGRKSDELRDIQCEVDLLPRVHGSAVFQRGETQAFVTVTLGTGRDEQRVDGLFDEYTKRFMLDYNFPSFSVGECRPIRGPGRREIGHGALAERSVNPVLPDHEKFPYTIRVISDILESNGSSSMASVCGATLGLMAAGVPISNPVAGISVGLVKEGEKWTLLTDIIGNEDHFGDMDFKIAGTQNGITGIQLDLKIKGISEEIIRATLKQSREARIEILRKIISTIARPRATTAESAPRLLRTKINPEKIGLLIGPGGKTIRGIQEEVGCNIDVDEDGTVTVAAADQATAEAGLARVDALTASVQVGKIYDGRVTSVKDFGAFVEILPGRDGLCHISELSNEYVGNVGDVCSVGDQMKVKVILVDEQDRVKLSRRAAMEELGEQEAEPADAAS